MVVIIPGIITHIFPNHKFVASDGGASYLLFRNMTFSNILKKMERHYNVEIENRHAELANEEFNASFGDEPISKILKYLQMTYDIEYTINKNKILIN